MRNRMESGVPKSRPSLANQTDGPLYLDEIVRKVDLIRPSHLPTSGGFRLDVETRLWLPSDDLRPLVRQVFDLAIPSGNSTLTSQWRIHKPMCGAPKQGSSKTKVVCAYEDWGALYNDTGV